MGMNVSSTLASRVRARRGELGLSARALSLRAGLSPAMVGIIERGGVRDPHGSTLEKLANALAVPLAWLQKGELTATGAAA